VKYLMRATFTGWTTTREPGSPLAAERTTTVEVGMKSPDDLPALDRPLGTLVSVEVTNMSTKADADLLIAAVRKIRETLP